MFSVILIISFFMLTQFALKRKNSETQMKKYKHIKKIIQQDMRKAYWEFIEKMIFNIPDQEQEAVL
jgi:hypothetical protein